MSERAAAGKEMESIDAGVPNIDYRCFENIDDIDVNIDALKTSMTLLTSLFLHLYLLVAMY